MASRGESRGTLQSEANNFIQIPAGTLLFHAFCLEEDERRSSFFKSMLGVPIPSGYCLTDIFNVYTFPFPYVGFGIFDFKTKRPIWEKFNAFTVFVTTQDMKFVSMINPSPDSRGIPRGPESISQRCDKFLPTPCYERIEDPAERERLQADFQQPLPGDPVTKPPQAYDNCLVPSLRVKHRVAGSISIASLDSLPREPGRKPKPAFEDSFGKYLRLLDPVKQSMILTSLYTDTDNNRGVPEITIHPEISKIGHTFVSGVTLDESLQSLRNFLGSGRNMIIPVATITAQGIYSVYSQQEAVRNANTARQKIEKNIEKFMKDAIYGRVPDIGKVKYDRRTGFFCASSYQSRSDYGNYLVSLDNKDGSVDYNYMMDYAVNNKFSTDSRDFDKVIKEYRRLFIFERPRCLRDSFLDSYIDIETFPEELKRFLKKYVNLNCRVDRSFIPLPRNLTIQELVGMQAARVAAASATARQNRINGLPFVPSKGANTARASINAWRRNMSGKNRAAAGPLEQKRQIQKMLNTVPGIAVVPEENLPPDYITPTRIPPTKPTGIYRDFEYYSAFPAFYEHLPEGRRSFGKLPEGWKYLRDPITGRIYYQKGDEVTWDMPLSPENRARFDAWLATDEGQKTMNAAEADRKKIHETYRKMWYPKQHANYNKHKAIMAATQGVGLRKLNMRTRKNNSVNNLARAVTSLSFAPTTPPAPAFAPLAPAPALASALPAPTALPALPAPPVRSTTLRPNAKEFVFVPKGGTRKKYKGGREIPRKPLDLLNVVSRTVSAGLDPLTKLRDKITSLFSFLPASPEQKKKLNQELNKQLNQTQQMNTVTKSVERPNNLPIISSPPMLIPPSSVLPTGAHEDLSKIYKEIGPLISAAIQRSITENTQKNNTKNRY